MKQTILSVNYINRPGAQQAENAGPGISCGGYATLKLDMPGNCKVFPRRESVISLNEKNI